MAKFRKRVDVEVEAVQWFANSGVHHPGVWCDGEGPNAGKPYVITIHNQAAYLEDGDWIVAEPKPHCFYPVKPDIFAATYEAVEDQP
jgi:hypothetical protein